ncbi:hypothetical protein [Salipiger abyssi]|uniref:hypothetical protein n=1 Tax=Salipiger abyssi TaxID=1250539 RepID=UPI00081A3B26|nr:hypothetical protein [Salipiger abyssi]ALF02140.1 hypothetical protein vBPeaSP1_049 [Pelagibaca phage vB_PeaS-P1]
MAAPVIRPELSQALCELRGSMAVLRLAMHSLPPDRARQARSPEHGRAADDLRALDRAYTELTGVILKEANGPAYRGPLYEWRRGAFGVRKSTLSALERVRRGAVGFHPLTAHVGRHYFASIWPAGAAWPAGIDRPFIPEGEVS